MKHWLNLFRQLTRSEKFLLIINAGNLICSLANTVLALTDRPMLFGLGLFAIITTPLLALAIHGSLVGKSYALTG